MIGLEHFAVGERHAPTAIGDRDRANRHPRDDLRGPDRRCQPLRELLVAPPQRCVSLSSQSSHAATALNHGQVAEIALPAGNDAVVGRHHRVEPRLAERRDIEALDERSDRAAVERFGVGGAPRLAGIGDRFAVDVHSGERLLHFFPERLGLVSRQPLAAEDDWRVEILFSRFDQLELEALGVLDPARVVRADQLAAALDVLAGHHVGEADDAAADAVARLDDGDVVAGLRQLVRGREAAEAGANDDDASGLGLCGEAAAELIAEENAGSRSERSLDHLPAGNRRRPASKAT